MHAKSRKTKEGRKRRKQSRQECGNIEKRDKIEEREEKQRSYISLLRNKGWEVHEEVHCISEDDSHRRADITAINRQQQTAIIIDPTIRMERERDPNQAHQVDHEERAIYEPFIPHLSAKYNIPLFNWSVTDTLRKLASVKQCLPPERSLLLALPHTTCGEVLFRLSTPHIQRILNLTGPVDNNDVTLQRNRNKTVGRIDGCHGDCISCCLCYASKILRNFFTAISFKEKRA
ncbi:hypothetical protein ANN_02723 [Periplaneta americana]|uniref:Uncharacterized protein n=1 Tax=Periplaneta americana TaxID=6978 RepID=A0ABQ8U001_PERAM|nr:hypothetical protein ANN_02723 [Periplaneta americana]